MQTTDWHHLFGMALKDFFTDTFYEVVLEEELSMKKQYLDVLIVRKGEGGPPSEMPDGFENMADHNLLSYKSMREPFDDWTADELLGHFVSYRKQASSSLKKLLPKKDFRLYGVCTRYPQKLARYGKLRPVGTGIYDLRWGSRAIRIIVTRRIPKERRNALWLMFSAVRESVRYGVSNYDGRLDEMSSTIGQMLVKYQIGGLSIMPYTVEDYRKELERNVLKSLTPERRLEGLSIEDRLRGIPTEERLRGVPAEDRFRGLSDEEIEACLKKLEKKRGKS